MLWLEKRKSKSINLISSFFLSTPHSNYYITLKMEDEELQAIRQARMAQLRGASTASGSDAGKHSLFSYFQESRSHL